MTRNHRIAILGVAFVVVGAVGAAAGTRIDTPTEVKARYDEPEREPTVAPVERRNLDDVIITRGKVTAGNSFGVMAPVDAPEPVVTATPAPPGTAVGDLGTVIEISGRPVFAATGTTPMYRDLGPGDDGNDVLQLESALERTGHHRGRVDGVFDTSTEIALDRLYAGAGYDTPIRERTVPSVDPLAPPTTTLERYVPRSELAFVPTLPANVRSVPGVGAAPEGPVAVLDTGHPTVTVALSETQAAVVATGHAVTVTTDTGDVTGTVTRIAAADDGSTATVTTKDPLPQTLVAADLKVAIAITTVDDALVLPVAALTQSADGTYHVSVVDDPAGPRRAVTVDVTALVGGSAAVTGDLDPGDLVITADTP